MNKNIKLNLDVSVLDEKKEMAKVNEKGTEMIPQQNDNMIIPGSAKKARRKKGLVIGLVIAGMLFTGLVGYGLGRMDNKERPVVQKDKEVSKDVDIIDVTEDDAWEDGIYVFETMDRAQGPNQAVSQSLNEFPTDSVTKEIIDRGYYYELDNVVEDGIFKLELVGATGDTRKPMLLLNIYVDDEKIIANNDKIQVFAYCLGEQAYKTQLAHYGQWDAYGKQSAENPHLYQVTLPSGIWLNDGKPVVFDMTKIRLGSQQTAWQDYVVSLKTIVDIPYGVAFFPVYQIYNSGLEFKTDTRTYRLVWTNLGYYESTLEIHFNPEESNSSSSDSEMRLWYDFINEFILEVNGVEYKVNPSDKGILTYADGEYYSHPGFPGITDDEIESVIVKYGDTAYKIK